MDHIMLKIRERYNQMSKGDKRISDFVLENHDRLLGMTAADIAQASGGFLRLCDPVCEENGGGRLGRL